MTIPSVAIHNWVYEDGTAFGCGTATEFTYWQAEGIIAPDAVLGDVIGHEPASEDARRKAVWGLADLLDQVAA